MQQPRAVDRVQDRAVPIHDDHHLFDVPGVQPGVFRVRRDIFEAGVQRTAPRVVAGATGAR
ncbi:hypothetical protein [Amycolatopsis vastitatis]|uniref:hypothetical protein n=1 Tax=Amycolatopsis vastitatis TaxID=1905142 RepID=UPI00117842D8|nr:hypothetical protein [Amycolatopsis vastitatis]